MYNYILPALIASIGWGISPFFESIVVKNTNVETALTYKGLFYGIIGLVIFISNSKHFLKIKDKYYTLKQFDNKKVNLLVFSFFGVICSYVIGTMAYLVALNNNTGATMLVPLISYVMPLVFMTVISFFVTKEKVNIKMLLGIFITIGGIAYTLYNKPE